MKNSIFLFLLFGNISIGLSQITNSQINYELRVDQWYQGCENDNAFISADDNEVKVGLTSDANTGGTATWTIGGNGATCTGNNYVRRWQADAPSTVTNTNTLLYRCIGRNNVANQFRINHESWEEDGSPDCDRSGDACNSTGTWDVVFKSATKLGNRWWAYNGTSDVASFVTGMSGDFSAKTVWRYTNGASCSTPLNFGTLVSGSTYTHTNTNRTFPIGASSDMGYSNVSGNSSPDVFYQFLVTNPSTVVISLVSPNTNFDTYLRLFTGGCGTQLAFNDDYGGSVQSYISMDLCPGTYVIQVEGFSGNTGDFNLSVQATNKLANGGTIAGIANGLVICSADDPGAFTNSVSATGIATLAYQWESSTTSAGAGYTNISGAITDTYDPGTLASTTWFRRKVTDGCGNVAYSNVIQVVVTSPVGNPAVFGTNVWNVYGYNGNSTTIASNTYRGNYIQPALGGGNEGIATQNFWGNGNSPSNAGTTLDNGNLWNGCSVNADNHTVVHKRRGFACGTYTFTLNNWDDETRIIINGVNVWSCGVWSGNPGGYSNSTGSIYSCASGTTFTYQLDANSEVEIQVFEGIGGSNVGVDIVKVVPLSLAGNVSRTCPTSGSAFIDFTDASGRLIASVNPNSNNLGNVTITSYVGTPAVMNACAQPSNPLYSTVYMGRTWVMNSSAYPSGTNFPSNVTVRLPFNNSELTSLNTAADASTTGNPNDGGTTTPATLANLMLTKITGATENGVANAADCASTILGITANAGTGTNYLSIASTSYIDFNVGQFSEFFLHKNNANMPLPVELISFSGTCTDKGTELTWQTASESNNDYFIVQRSRDGQNWEDLTTVSGNGNSTQLIDYDWLDEAGFGDMYYRLTQVDFNGDRYEKQAIFVNCESESTKFNVYPNPTQADFTVEVNSTKEVESATISIIDVTGKALVHRNVEIHSGVNTFNFGDQLESGTYLIRVSIEGEIQTLRLVVKN